MRLGANTLVILGRTGLSSRGSDASNALDGPRSHNHSHHVISSCTCLLLFPMHHLYLISLESRLLDFDSLDLVVAKTACSAFVSTEPAEPRRFWFGCSFGASMN